jgi:hypothetical protein
MAGFEKLLEVRAYNAAAAEEETQRQLAELGASLDPRYRDSQLREGIPLELWRALKR